MIEHLLEPLVCTRFINDARYREGHLRVVNALPQRRVLGLHTPDMKRLAKELSADGVEVVLHGKRHRCNNGRELIACFEQVGRQTLCHEEIMIWGFLINLEKCSLDKHFAMLSRFVPVLDNWAVCDAYCADAKWMRRADKELLWGFLQPWFSSHREFEVRFAVVASMCCLLTADWVERLFARIDALDFRVIESEYRTVKGKPECVQEGSVQGAEPYYVRMAVAWLLATALAVLPVQTRAYIGGSLLPDDVLKLYVRKVRESLRTRDMNPF